MLNGANNFHASQLLYILRLYLLSTANAGLKVAYFQKSFHFGPNLPKKCQILSSIYQKQ